MDLSQFKASLDHRASSRTDSKATQRNPVSKNKQTKKETKKRKQAWRGDVTHHYRLGSEPPSASAAPVSCSPPLGFGPTYTILTQSRCGWEREAGKLF